MNRPNRVQRYLNLFVIRLIRNPCDSNSLDTIDYRSDHLIYEYCEKCEGVASSESIPPGVRFDARFANPAD